MWQGSDFDLKAAIEISRRRLRDVPSAMVLEMVSPLTPVVAARHSHKTGTLRGLVRRWVDPTIQTIEPLGHGAEADGSLIYVVGPEAPRDAVERRSGGRPVAFVTTSDGSHLTAAAREVAAIDEVLKSTPELRNDWVAQRELLDVGSKPVQPSIWSLSERMDQPTGDGSVSCTEGIRRDLNG